MRKIEAYFIRTFKEKALTLAVLFFILLYPHTTATRGFFTLFIISLCLLPHDISTGRIKFLMELPFTHRDLFLSSYIFLIATSLTVQLIGEAFTTSFSTVYTAEALLSTVIFATAYFGIATITASFGLGSFGVPLLIFLADVIFGGIKGEFVMHSRRFFVNYTNPYSYISPIYQGSLVGAFVFSTLLLIFAYFVFERKGSLK